MIRFRVLGALDLYDEQGRELRAVLAQPKRSALLAYLAAAHPVGFHRRDTLLALFWPEMDDAHARDALNQALRYLRHEIGKDVIVSRGVGDVGVDGSLLWCDAAAFREHLSAGRTSEALELYRADFLQGVHVAEASQDLDEWVESRRRELRRFAADAALSLAEQAAEGGDTSTALARVQRAMAIGLESEAELRRAVSLLDRGGDRAAALQLYEAFARRLESDLGAEPTPETRRLIDEVRARRHHHEPVPPRIEAPRTRGVEPSPSPATGALPASPASATRRRPLAALLVSAALLTAVATTLLRSPDTGATAWLDNHVVVAPVNVLAPDLDLWREGLVDVLSRSLDGAGDLRAVAPAVVLRAAATPDAHTPDDLARATRAPLVLIGILQRTGADSARFSATLRDVAQQVTRGEVDRRDAIDRMDHLADSVAIDVLRLLLGETTSRSLSVHRVGTRSFAALKAYLQGQLHLRRRQWDSSETYFLRAVALDSTFALAYVGVAGSLEQRTDARAVPSASSFAFRAAAFNRGLGARDSAMIALDSVYLAAYSNTLTLPRDPQHWTDIRRALTAAERLVSEYPNDAELWGKYAEVLYHVGGVATGTRESEVLEAFDRAIELDSALGPAYSHTSGLALLLHGWEYQKRYGISAARHRIGMAARDHEVVTALERAASVAPRHGRTLVDTLRIDVLWSTYPSIVVNDADGGLFPAAAARLRGGIRNGTLTGVTEQLLNDVTVRSLLKFGRYREAAALVDAESQPLQFAVAALLGAVPDDRARPVFAAWLDRPVGPFECLRLLEWWAQRGDTASIARCASGRANAFRSDSLAAVRRMARPAALMGEGFKALARRDTARAVRVFDTFPDSLCPVWCWFTLGPRARLLASVGRAREALDLASHRSHVDFAFPAMTVPAALARARLAVQVGDRSALDAYRVVAEAWARADSSLQPAVAEARAAIARIDGTATTGGHPSPGAARPHEDRLTVVRPR